MIMKKVCARAVLATSVLALGSACVTSPEGPKSTQSVLDKQYAASAQGPAMPAWEALAIQKKYEEQVGKPLPDRKPSKMTRH